MRHNLITMVLAYVLDTLQQTAPMKTVEVVFAVGPEHFANQILVPAFVAWAWVVEAALIRDIAEMVDVLALERIHALLLAATDAKHPHTN